MTLTIAAALRVGAARLGNAGVPDAAGDARRLMAFALGIEPGRLTLLQADPIPESAQTKWDAAIAARTSRQPVSQIIGRREFWGRAFRVTRDTLDPRPETEAVVAEALSRPFSRMLDLGTGTGCILLSCLADMPAATGIGTDISLAALVVAEENARVLGLADRAGFRNSDWFAEVPDRFDLIVSNPPYIAASEVPDLSPEVRQWEPHQALSPGGDGLAAYRAIIAGAPPRLLKGGRLILEIGWTQGPDVAGLCAAAGFGNVRTLNDMDGRHRVISADLF